MFNKIAIFGLGLLGGSLCKTIKRFDTSVDIVAYGRNAERLRIPYEEGNINSIGNIDNASLIDIDLIVVSTPVIVSVDIIKYILNHPELEKNAIVIDVGSAKELIIAEIEKCSRADRFIGCHPMAGSESSGYEYSSSDLYSNSSVFITPNRFNRSEDIDKISNFWKTINAVPIVVEAQLHDLIAAFTSHLPHMLACALVDLINDIVEDKNDSPLTVNSTGSQESNALEKIGIENFFGKGFMDVTRISKGSPEMWADILIQNRKNVELSLQKIIEKLLDLKDSLHNMSDVVNLKSFFRKVKNIKEGLSS